MYCEKFIETDDAFVVIRDNIDNYDGTEVYPTTLDENGDDVPGANILSTLEAKTKITL